LSSSKAKSILSNFDVHNGYNEPIYNFELELYGPRVPNDVTWWFPGWGAPSWITPIPGGINLSMGPLWYSDQSRNRPGANSSKSIFDATGFFPVTIDIKPGSYIN